MNPNKTLIAFLEAIKEGDFQEANLHFLALDQWLDKGGAMPDIKPKTLTRFVYAYMRYKCDLRKERLNDRI